MIFYRKLVVFEIEINKMHKIHNKKLEFICTIYYQNMIQKFYSYHSLDGTYLEKIRNANFLIFSTMINGSGNPNMHYSKIR